VENLADWRALARIGLGQIDLYCHCFARPPAHSGLLDERWIVAMTASLSAWSPSPASIPTAPIELFAPCMGRN
jgi:hypothetical protein